MPTDSTSAASSNNVESTPTQGASTGDIDLTQRANNAKTQLIQEILAFNTEVATVENAGEDHKDERE